jgi:hypothetical protein
MTGPFGVFTHEIKGESPKTSIIWIPHGLDPFSFSIQDFIYFFLENQCP